MQATGNLYFEQIKKQDKQSEHCFISKLYNGDTSKITKTEIERTKKQTIKHKTVENQPVRFFVTSKTNKFKSLEEINVDQLKLRSIIDQTGTYIYKASKVIDKYLKPLAKNEYTISDTLTFPYLVKNASNSNEYKDVLYDVESLFASTPVEETINYSRQNLR